MRLQHLFNEAPCLSGQSASSMEWQPNYPRRGNGGVGWAWASSPTTALLAICHTYVESRKLYQLKAFFEPRELAQFKISLVSKKVSLFLKKPGKSLSKCFAESLCGFAVPCVSPPLPLPSTIPSLHNELRMELFSFSLLLVKFWSIQPILVYQPNSYLKRACQSIINSSNFIIAVKRHEWDCEYIAERVRDLFRLSLC